MSRRGKTRPPMQNDREPNVFVAGRLRGGREWSDKSLSDHNNFDIDSFWRCMFTRAGCATVAPISRVLYL